MQDDKRVQGAVSLWVGLSPSKKALENYADVDYSTSDLSQISQLDDDFGTGLYDHDFMDTSFHEKPTRSLTELLRGCSYDTLIVPKFAKLCGDFIPDEANAVVLLYNFQHNGSVVSRADAGGPVKLRYLGSITVEMPWPD